MGQSLVVFDMSTEYFMLLSFQINLATLSPCCLTHTVRVDKKKKKDLTFPDTSCRGGMGG